MSAGLSYVATPVQSGQADGETLAAWLSTNEHQSLDILKLTLRDYGYDRSRIMAAFIIYVDKDHNQFGPRS